MATNHRILRETKSEEYEDGSRPRMATYGGSELKPYRLRTTSQSGSLRHIAIRLNGGNSSLSNSASRMVALSSTDSLFGSFLPPKLDSTNTNSAGSKQLKHVAYHHHHNHNGGTSSVAMTSPAAERDVDTNGDETNGMLTGNRNSSNTKQRLVESVSQSSSVSSSATNSARLEPFEAWKVLLSCTLIFVLIGINWVAFPLFYVEFSERFAASQSVLGWIGSLQNAGSQIIGLFVSAPVQVYGCRPVAVAGGVILALGTALSALSPNVGFLYASYGVISGE